MLHKAARVGICTSALLLTRNHASVTGDIWLPHLLKVLRESIFETLQSIQLQLGNVFKLVLSTAAMNLWLVYTVGWLNHGHHLLLLHSSRWPTGWVFDRKELLLLQLLIPELQFVRAGGFCPSSKALHLHFVVLHEFVGANIFDCFSIKDVLTNFLKRFSDSSVNLHRIKAIHSSYTLMKNLTYIHEVLNKFFVNDILVLEGCHTEFLQVDW